MRPIPSIPSFALVGQPNEGKTTVMATLAEDDQAEISSTPGTTRFGRRYPVLIDGAEILIFHDTPGFENPEAVLQWFRDNHELDDPLQSFIDTFADTGRFHQEVEILKPLAAGAAAIYIADASRPVRPVDKDDVEILRLAGVRRIGVINPKERDGEYLHEWKKFMNTDFNHIHEFNAHRATFKDRIKLLEAARAIMQEWEGSMDRSVQALREDWEGRLRDVTTLLVEDVKILMDLRERETIQHAGDEERAAGEAKQRIMNAVRERERKFRKRVRAIFHHSDERWIVDDLLQQDLFSEEVWRLLGLTRTQLALMGAIIGAIAGGVIDAHTLAASWGAGAALGFVAGAAATWFYGEKAVDVKMPRIKLGPFSIGGSKMGGKQVEASITSQSNILWVVVDRYLLYIELCASWAHGKRVKSPTRVGDDKSKRGFTTNWARDDRGKVTDFVGHIRRKKRNQEKLDDAERAMREMLLNELRNLTLR
jgi:hypothetical protein